MSNKNVEDDESKLYCTCRAPDDGTFMLACDRCEDWYVHKEIEEKRDVEEIEEKEKRKIQEEKLIFCCFFPSEGSTDDAFT
jgi:hypothetical protein